MTQRQQIVGDLIDRLLALQGVDGAADVWTVNRYLQELDDVAGAIGGAMASTRRFTVFGKEYCFVGDKQRSAYAVPLHPDEAELPAAERGHHAMQQRAKELGIMNDVTLWYRAGNTGLFLMAAPPHLVFENSQQLHGDPELRRVPRDSKAYVAAREKYYSTAPDWHCWAVKIDRTAVQIYDPSYVRPQQPHARRRLNAIPNNNLVRQLMDQVKTLRGIMIGGGGNYSSACRTMALEWMKQELLAELGYSRIGGPIVPVEEWELLHDR